MASAHSAPELPVIPKEQLIEKKEYPVAFGGYGYVFQCIMQPLDQETPSQTADARGVYEPGLQPLRQDPEHSQGALVAVKVLKYTTDQVSKKRARREMALWMKAKHKNIVPMLGITDKFCEEGFAMVSPWMNGGTLAQYIGDHKGNMTCRKKMTLIKDIINGLAFLHSLGIVHGDLTTNNIMLDDNELALLIDFGLSHVLGVSDSNSCLALSPARPGAVRFAAPELLDVEGATNQPRSQDDYEPPMPDMASDIYSLGCVMLNVFTEKRPWYPYGDMAVAGLQQTRRSMPIPDHIHLSERRKQFVCECTSISAGERPSSQDAVVFIERELVHIEDTQAPIQQVDSRGIRSR
ncbi:kinase-like domain-containing protein [Suillus lakei]|nr:kinase-like domain-containing protein [Suillus lakei]